MRFPPPTLLVALCHSREQAEEVKARLAEWLTPRGLAFSEDKTRIVYLDEGCDFLGFNVRRYQGKLLIKPSDVAVKRFRKRLAVEMLAQCFECPAFVPLHSPSRYAGSAQYCPRYGRIDAALSWRCPAQTGRCAMERSSSLYPRLAVVVGAFVLTWGGLVPGQAAASAAVETCEGLSATITGTNGADTLTGTSGNDVIVGLGGNDTISGLGGDDTICAGGGNDTVYGDVENPPPLLFIAGNDRILGEGGTDDLFGDFRAFTTIAGVGVPGANDYLDGGEGGDTIYGNSETTTSGGGGSVGAANNTIKGGSGNDVIYGGSRTLTFTTVVLALANGNDDIDAGDGADLVFGDNENLNLGALTTSSGSRDTITTGEGADTIYGDAKNLTGTLVPVLGGHDDTIDGGVGSDGGDAGPGTADDCTDTETVINCEL